MNLGSLFTGIGGFDFAASQVGIEVSWQCEIDKQANRILNKHWPRILRYGDIRAIDFLSLQSVDILTGGFPCQDLSLIGNRAGLHGERSVLFFEFARILDELRPRWFILENVPGLLSSNHGYDFLTVLHTLEKCGYSIAWRILDAQYFGVPQRRRRVFIIGHFGSKSEYVAKVLFERKSMSGNHSTCRQSRTVSPTLLASGAGTSHTAGFSGAEDYLVIQNLPNSLDVGVRRFTPLECERLQGFPDNWTKWDDKGKTLSDSARYRLIGNAVAIPVVKWILDRIVVYS